MPGRNKTMNILFNTSQQSIQYNVFDVVTYEIGSAIIILLYHFKDNYLMYLHEIGSASIILLYYLKDNYLM